MLKILVPLLIFGPGLYVQVDQNFQCHYDISENFCHIYIYIYYYIIIYASISIAVLYSLNDILLQLYFNDIPHHPILELTNTREFVA